MSENKNNNNTNDMFSLQKSHSKWSNFKLTMICLGAALFFALIFVGLGMTGIKSFGATIGILVTLVGLLGTALFAVLLKNFKR